MTETIQQRAGGAMTAVNRWIGRYRVTRVTRRAALGFLAHEGLQYAGSMAYFAILSIFQLLVLAVVTGSFFLGEGQARDFVLGQVSLNSPINADTVAKIIDNIIAARGGIGLVGLVLLTWSALGLFSALNRGISRAFVTAAPRPFLQDKLLGLALMAFAGALAVISLAIGVVAGIAQQVAGDAIGRVPGGELALYLVDLLVPLALVFIVLLVLYRVVPNRPITVSEVWPGAMVGAVLWTVLRFGFTFYATHIAKYDSAFGPISTGISLLVFLYFASIVLLIGAEVARANSVEMD